MFVRDEIVVPEAAGWVLARLEQYLRSESAAGRASDTAQDQDALLLRAGVSVATKQVVIRALPTAVTAAGAEIALSWSATGPMHDLYPSLEATISVEAVDAGSTRVRMIGSYLPPMGNVGVVIDRVIGRRFAAATVRSFLDRVEHRVLDRAAPASPERAASVWPRVAARFHES
ncbi:MAG TPA: hypothetical protein VGN18_02855 [Jatrophihabitans sp.]|uniref:hypothetical protein n=1 Tax=Jatrophihabitans sp. TaxID=1932789 RepID=UPI002E0C1D66|nr:hypothetical protein [Jatrophihabitans sp.]